MNQLREDAKYLELVRVANEDSATEMVTLLKHVGWNRPDGSLSIHKRTSLVGRQAFAAIGFTEEGPTGALIPDVLARAARWSSTHGFDRLAIHLADFVNATWPDSAARTSENPLSGSSPRPEDVLVGNGDTEELPIELDQPIGETAMTLVEVTPGIAVAFGRVPDGVELIEFGLLPSLDREQLSTALGSLGNLGTTLGNAAEAVSNAQGLYRINDATLSLLKSGGELATKDGAKLGAIFKNGKLVAQARFVPASMTAAAAVAAIGPAVAMLALQMQLGEITNLARTNIALTKQTLRTIRNEQWSELEGISEAVTDALQEARELDAITDSVWEPIAPSGPTIRKQMNQYRRNVLGHIQELGTLVGRPRRDYLESNAEAIVFDTYALLSSLKTHAEYQALRAAVARTRGVEDENDAQLFDRISRRTLPEIEDSLREITQLTDSLVRELRIIAELPGRATLPLTKRRRDTKASKLTCEQLLAAVSPLTEMLVPALETPSVPEVVCAPSNVDLDPYLNVLRWYLEDGEELLAVAFPYVTHANPLARAVPALLAKQVDASWGTRTSGKAAAVAKSLTSSEFIAVTDRRIVTARPSNLLRLGELGETYRLEEVKYVRPRTNYQSAVRPTIAVTTERDDLQWMFPSSASHENIDDLAQLIEQGAFRVSRTRGAIESTTDETATHSGT